MISEHDIPRLRSMHDSDEDASKTSGITSEGSSKLKKTGWLSMLSTMYIVKRENKERRKR